MVENGEAVTPYSVMKKSKLAKSFIYTNEEVKAYIERFRSEKQYNPRKYTEQDAAMERIEFIKKENWALRKELKAYKKESVDALLRENEILRFRLKKYEQLVEAGVVTLPVMGQGIKEEKLDD